VQPETAFGADRATRTAFPADHAAVHRPGWTQRRGGGWRGNLYVTSGNGVLSLDYSYTHDRVLPFGLSHPEGVAVDSNFSVYVTDGGNGRVLKLAADSNTQIRVAVHRPQQPARCGGRQRRRRLHRQRE
jgi:NHL repeat